MTRSDLRELGWSSLQALAYGAADNDEIPNSSYLGVIPKGHEEFWSEFAPHAVDSSLLKESFPIFVIDSTRICDHKPDFVPDGTEMLDVRQRISLLTTAARWSKSP